MKRILIAALMSSLLISCEGNQNKNNNGRDLSKIKIGMSYTEVLNLVGFPDGKTNLGNVQDSLGNQTHREEWSYGDNQSLLIVNDRVNSIDLDRKETMAKIQHIIDSARAAGAGNSFSIEPNRP